MQSLEKMINLYDRTNSSLAELKFISIAQLLQILVTGSSKDDRWLNKFTCP